MLIRINFIYPSSDWPGFEDVVCRHCGEERSDGIVGLPLGSRANVPFRGQRRAHAEVSPPYILASIV